MEFGERVIQRGMRGRDVEELQIRLAGFRGTLPDGDFGAGTELQVVKFQQDFMGTNVPNGIVDDDTFAAIERFAQQFPLDFDALRCPCGECAGFGRGRFKGIYQTGNPRVEAHHRYEYPGIHRMILWAVRAAFFYARGYGLTITSGYRCGVRNQQTGRSSTNHHGKAIDFDVTVPSGGDRRDDMRLCNEVRGLLVQHANAQVGWAAPDRKAVVRVNIAPRWIHSEVRCYESKYLEDRFFCRSRAELDAAALVEA
jgi:hypothetical protein